MSRRYQWANQLRQIRSQMQMRQPVRPYYRPLQPAYQVPSTWMSPKPVQQRSQTTGWGGRLAAGWSRPAAWNSYDKTGWGQKPAWNSFNKTGWGQRQLTWGYRPPAIRNIKTYQPPVQPPYGQYGFVY